MIPYNPKKNLETNYYNKTEVELLIAGGAGGSGVQNVFIQEAEPTIDVGTSALWIQKSLDGSITFNLIEN